MQTKGSTDPYIAAFEQEGKQQMSEKPPFADYIGFIQGFYQNYPDKPVLRPFKLPSTNQMLENWRMLSGAEQP